MSNAASSPQRQAEADLASLKRVSHRLALTTADKLGQVLNKLLPRLIQRLAENHPKIPQGQIYNEIHLTLMEMLSHTMKRVRQDANVKLPCLALLELLKSNESSPLIWNFGLTFLTMGMPRYTTTSDEVYPMLPLLIELTAQKNLQLSSITNPMIRKQGHQLAHLLLRAIPLLLLVPDQNSNKEEEKQQGQDSNQRNEMYLEETRKLLGDSKVAAPIFDLLLDVLLYQPTTGSIPPPGVAQLGQERLKGGNSTIEKDWGVEMLVNSNHLIKLKLDILNIIAPSRKVFLFGTQNKLIPLVLLVVASGDTSVQVVEHATTLLKIYLDSFRGSNSSNNDDGNDSTTTATSTASNEVYGNPIRLLKELLVLGLGQTRADSLLNSSSQTEDVVIPSLGVSFSVSTTTADPKMSQAILSSKRRPLSENGLSVVFEFCTKILEEVPMLFEIGDDDGVESQTTASMRLRQVRFLSNLFVATISKTLSGSLTTSASGLNKTRGRPYVAAAKLLNTFVVRLCVFYDARCCSGNTEEEDDSSVRQLRALLGQTLQCACQSISPVTLQRVVTNSNTSAGNIAIRDSCYGVVMTLTRSNFAYAKEFYLFNVGKSSNTFVIDTTTLLFKCTTNETETLRPRVVAALDAVLGAHARVFVVDDVSSSSALAATSAGNKEALTNETAPTMVVDNPWMAAPSISSSVVMDGGANDRINSSAKNNKVGVDASTVCQSLLPLLWSASQPHQTKASRVAAARWSSDLIHKLDLCHGAYILCYLAGDTDVTAANIARDGLGLLPTNTQTTEHPNAPFFEVPIFSDFVDTVYEQNADSVTQARKSGSTSQTSITPKFLDFSAQGKATVLRYTLLCLLADLYEGEEYSVDAYVSSLAETLRSFLESEQQGSVAPDLLDEAAICLNSLLGSSQFARKQIVASAHSGMGHKEIEKLATGARSSKARRHFAGCFGKLCEDVSLWVVEDDEDIGVATENNDPSRFERWVESSGIQAALKATLERFDGLKKNHYSTGPIHGTAYLSARCVKAIRRLGTSSGDRSSSSNAAFDWNEIGSLLISISTNLTHSDEVIGNACADALCIAFSYNTADSPLLDPTLVLPLSSILDNVTMALKKFGHGDHTDATRATRIVRASGSCLAASVACDTNMIPESAAALIADVRRKCAQGILNLQASDVMRKDEEILLVAGEALADYADSYSPNSDCWQDAGDWTETHDEAFQRKLAPHDEILYVLLKKCMTVSNPRVRTSTAPLLLAIVARASRRVSSASPMVAFRRNCD